ncbi:TetR family transcriptional regulator [Dyella caseinilytica]|uniref:TetR family transcriptional regulator n=1 Tax=Dyella caseinilytica TaxID=1849581 RepID=A0ABX7GXG6_9GAMM|nr:TetR family transcriptional regulator [Dyella caseinilytica]QRN54974.1 TetR family transcriptional regulator [Dyella caseinilytica]GFZ98356.1 TetR family transcriptional regulator [Dyella caseinilytica]
MTTSTFQRARSHEAKQLRLNEILEAARALGTEHGVGNVSLTDIAEAVGMHKSAMLRYFETREQIFLILTASAWQAWAEDVTKRVKRSGDMSPKSVASALAKSLGNRPFFCDLLAHAALSLERHVSLDAVRTFKFAALDSAYAIATQLQECASLTQRQAIDTVTTATSMAGALWQMATPAPEVLPLYQSDPRLSHVVADITPRLASILENLLLGFGVTNRASR